MVSLNPVRGDAALVVSFLDQSWHQGSTFILANLG